jgi:hypothetical protein
MATSSSSSPEQTDLNTQKLPSLPTVKQMKTWDAGTVLRWIQQRHRHSLVEEEDLNNFKNARFAGRAFLVSDAEFYQTCGLPRGVGLTLQNLADEVKEKGNIIPRT